MSRISIYSEENAQYVQLSSELLMEIQELLRDYNVDYRHVPFRGNVEQLLEQMPLQTDLKRDIVPLENQHQFPFSSVVLLSDSYPNYQRLRIKYLSEFFTEQDEIVYVLQGEMLVYFHDKQNVVSLLCRPGDCLLIPKQTKHWVDIGDATNHLALMFCKQQNQEPVILYTGSSIADKYPRLA